MRFATTRLGKDVVDLVDASVTLRRPAAPRPHHLAPRAGRAGRHRRRQRRRQVHPAARASPATSRSPAGKRKEGKTVQLAYLTQEVRELERYADWRVIEAIEDVRKYIRLGSKEISASQLAQRLGFTGGRPADAGRRPVRRRAAAAAAPCGC